MLPLVGDYAPAHRKGSSLSIVVSGLMLGMLVASILLGIVLFNVTVTPLNGVGMFITVLGAAYYSKVELDRKRAAAPK